MGLNRDRGRLNAKMTMANLYEDGVRVDSPDARLIAAAPELLAALKELVAYDEGSGDPEDYGWEVLCRCKESIAKAEGRSE